MKTSFDAVKKALDKRIADRYIAGAACKVTLNGKEVFDYCEGYADIEAGRKLDHESTYRLASMTKPFTGIITALMRERGLLSYDDEVCKYIPAFADVRVGKDGEKLKRNITIRDCMTHSSGIGQDEATAWCMNAYQTEQPNLQRIVEGYSHTNTAFQPGTRTNYSPIAAPDVAARICEIVSGKSFGQLIAEEICGPLGMTNTTFEPTDEQWRRICEVYMPDTLRKMKIGRHTFSGDMPPYDCGGAGLVSTMDDYVKLSLMLLGEGEYNGKRILSRTSCAEMRRPQLAADTEGLGLDMNWGILMRTMTLTNENQYLPIGCFGWSGAWGTHFWVDPANGLTAVLMMGGNCGGAGSPVARDIERAVYAEE